LNLINDTIMIDNNTFFIIKNIFVYEGKKNESPLLQKIEENKSVLLAWKNKDNAELFLEELKKRNKKILFYIEKENYNYLNVLNNEFSKDNHEVILKILD